MSTHDPEMMEKIISLAKRRGFIYPGSDIYGGFAGFYDYGPLGVALKNNITNTWWKMFVNDRTDMYGIDAAIIMNPRAWVASGHVAGFSDPLVECGNCKKRFRVDQLVSEGDYKAYLSRLQKVAKEKKSELAGMVMGATTVKGQDVSPATDEIVELLEKYGNAEDKIQKFIKETETYIGKFAQLYLNENITCESCGAVKKWGEPRQFNMMLKTQVGAIEDASSVAYLRPETAGGMFVNYKNVVDSFAPKMPFGLAQIGKAFRNEIAPRDFIFRVRELEQMEVEYFIKAEDWERAFEEWRQMMWGFVDAIGLPREKVHELEVAAEDLAHYSKRTIDFEFDFPFGKKELYGLAYRTDFDLNAHAKESGQSLTYFDEETKTRFVPHVIEPSLGVGRSLLAVLASAYHEDVMGDETRIVLRFKPSMAPIRCAVSPLLKNKPELVEKSKQVFGMLKKEFGRVAYDDNGNIGKRYRRQDEIGTPHCIVVDFDTLGENADLLDTVTVRNRDTGEQERVHLNELVAYLRSRD